MTEPTTKPPTDTRRFTPSQIAVAVAKALVHHAQNVSERWHNIVAERGIELAEDGAFTITTEAGQTFHLTVTEQAAADRATDVRRGIEQIASVLGATPADVVGQLRDITGGAR